MSQDVNDARFWRSLLVRYIRHVGEREGIDFVVGSDRMEDHVQMTPLEGEAMRTAQLQSRTENNVLEMWCRVKAAARELE